MDWPFREEERAQKASDRFTTLTACRGYGKDLWNKRRGGTKLSCNIPGAVHDWSLPNPDPWWQNIHTYLGWAHSSFRRMLQVITEEARHCVYVDVNQAACFHYWNRSVLVTDIRFHCTPDLHTVGQPLSHGFSFPRRLRIIYPAWHTRRVRHCSREVIGLRDICLGFDQGVKNEDGGEVNKTTVEFIRVKKSVLISKWLLND